MKTVKLTFELDQEAVKSTAYLMGHQLSDEQLQQLDEKDLIVEGDSEYFNNQEFVIGLCAIAVAKLNE